MAALSAQFRHRLEGSLVGTTVRAVVVLGEDGAALRILDEELSAGGGERLSPGPNALGTVTVRAPAATVIRLASLRGVEAVLEDQAIDPALPPRR